MNRRVTGSREVSPMMAGAFADATVNLGSNQSLIDLGFTAEQLSQADYIYMEPHVADAWIKITGNAPAVNDGHRVAQNQMAKIYYNYDITDLRITGSGACTITLLEMNPEIQ